MKNLLKLLLVLLFVFGSLNLLAGYVDLGNFPSKIQVKTILDIDIENGYEFENWSPDGKYFTAISYDSGKYKTNIYLLNGIFVKKIDGIIMQWSRDSKKILCFKWIKSKIKKKILYIYDIYDWSRKELNLDHKNQDSFQFYKDNTSLIYLYGEKNWERNIRKSEIWKWDIKTNSKELIYTYEGCKYINSDIKYIGDDSFVFTRHYCPKNKDDFRKAFYKLNLLKKIEKKLCENSPATIYTLNSGKIIIELSNENFIDINGQSYGKINTNCIENIPNKILNIKTSCIGGELFPNGKLYLFQVGTLPGDHLDRMKDSFIFIYNFNNKKKQLNLPNPTDYISISPVGNSFLAKIGGKYKLIVLEKKKI